MFNIQNYSIDISPATLGNSQYYIATVKELPDLVEYGKTYEEAHSLVVDSIEMLYNMAIEQNRNFPGLDSNTV
jgi:predicted RNase H-like HicB family nuclease